ncbi:MAG: tripartite tricarboxylate transporter TctB family protein [Desulfobacterales bacterium]|nr:tripartite tricarboxylate transporter TctB family protein [Desulfobacterales bacterium]
MALGNAKGWVAGRDANLWTGLFLMVFSGAVISEAIQLEIGTPKSPGSGFMIFGAASVLGLLELHQFIKSLHFQGREVKPAPEEIRWKRIVSVILANIIYIFLLQPVGYLLCTFLLLCFLFQIHEKGRWVSAVGGAALTSFLSYLVFSRMLQLHLPRGLISFF